MLFGRPEEDSGAHTNTVLAFSHSVEIELSPLPGPARDGESGSDDAVTKLNAAYFTGPTSTDKVDMFPGTINPGRRRRSTFHGTQPSQVPPGRLQRAGDARRERLSVQTVRLERQSERGLEEL
jgi:hypothetical protein